FTGIPLITLDATNAGGTGLTLAASNSTVKGLAISNESGTAVLISGGSGDLISNVDVSWDGAGQAGVGVGEYNGSLNNNISNVRADNRFLAFDDYNDNQVHLASNDYSGSHYCLLLHFMSGLTLNGPGGTGLNSTTIPVALEGVSNSLIENLNVSWGGPGQVGNGVQEYGNSLNNTISNVRADNRCTPIEDDNDTQLQLADE